MKWLKHFDCNSVKKILVFVNVQWRKKQNCQWNYLYSFVQLAGLTQWPVIDLRSHAGILFINKNRNLFCQLGGWWSGLDLYRVVLLNGTSGSKAKKMIANKVKGFGFYKQSIMLKKNLIETVLPIVA